MRELIDHLRPLRRPWICAHGRPTMRYLLNTDNFRSEFALPSKVKVNKNNYCSLSRKYRQCPPQLLTKIGGYEESQLDEDRVIYPTAELIELKRQFLVQKKQQEKEEAIREEDLKERGCTGTVKSVIQKEEKTPADRRTK